MIRRIMKVFTRTRFPRPFPDLFKCAEVQTQMTTYKYNRRILGGRANHILKTYYECLCCSSRRQPASALSISLMGDERGPVLADA